MVYTPYFGIVVLIILIVVISIFIMMLTWIYRKLSNWHYSIKVDNAKRKYEQSFKAEED